MNDPYLESFLDRQYEEGMELARNSDILDLLPVGERPYRRYIARFHCTGLVKTGRRITEHNCFDVGIQFTDQHLRHIDPSRIVTLLWPANCFHPNISWPFLCLGDLPAGTTLTTIIFQVYDVLSFMNFTPVERNAFNRAACIYARRHRDRFPLDRRPLRRPPAKDRSTKKSQRIKEKK
jgi:hypothetical protein